MLPIEDVHICSAVVTEEVANARESFNTETTELLSKIKTALGKAGPKTDSQKLTYMASQTTLIANRQVGVIV